MSQTTKVLLVEDNPAEANLIQVQLANCQDEHFSLEFAQTIDDGEKLLSQRSFDVVLLDFNLPDCKGLSGLERILARANGAPVVMLTNNNNNLVAAEAVRCGAQDYLFKREADARTLSRAIRYARERQAFREALRQSEDRYALALAGANDGIWDWDITQGRVHFSNRWKQMLGYQDHEVGVSHEEWFGLIHKDDRESFLKTLDAHLVGAIPHFEYEHRIMQRDGEYIWVLCRGLAITDPTGKPNRMAGSMTDITRRKQVEAQLMHEALHDPLTGLPNRALFLDRVQQALSSAARTGSYNFSVLYIDLDRFKNINDSLGHAAGDALLKAVAKRLGNFIRPSDTLARLGGDEFALLVFEGKNPSAVTLVADRVSQLLCEKFVVDDSELFIGVSIGIAMGSAKYAQPEDILRDADLAMYRAKHSDNTAHEVFDINMHRTAMDKLRIETELRTALADNSLVVHYQPIICIETGAITGFEALLRWNHPSLGMLYPDAFIQIAEDSGLVVPISWWVIEEACRDIGQLRRMSGKTRPVTVSVNISGKIFNSTDTASRLLDILARHNFEPEALHLEITEHSIMNHQHMSVAELDKLRAAGVELHIDDFGTGYSSLSHLQKYSYDTLKIDGSFISRMGECPDSEAIVKSIVVMGKLLAMNVVAECVETREQLERLIAIGCPFAQGFLFSPAVEHSKLDALLSSTPLAKQDPSTRVE